MKAKILSLMSFALMTFAYSACSGTDDFPEVQNSVQNKKNRIEIGIGVGGAATRTTLSDSPYKTNGSYWYDWLWDGNESLILSDENGYVATLSWESWNTENINYNKAIFSGSSDQEIFKGKTYRITYIGSGSTFDPNSMTFTVDFTKQDGTRAGLGTCNASSGTIVFDKGKDDIYFNPDLATVHPLLPVVDFEMKDKAGATATKTEMQGDGIFSSVTFQINGPEVGDIPTVVSYGGKTKLTFTKEESKHVFVTLTEEGAAPIFKRTYSDNSVAYGTPGKANSLEKASVYHTPVDMKYDSPIEIGTIQVADWGTTVGPNITFNK